MSSSGTRQHASGVSGSPQPPEPSYAERVRTLLSTASTATLSTMSRRHAGFPFGSLMPFALDHAGQPLFLISSIAVHTQNLSSDPRCSLFVAQENAEGDPLGAARATLLGSCEPVPSEEVATVRETYLTATPTAVTGSISPISAFFALRQSISTTSAASVLWDGSMLPNIGRPAPILSLAPRLASWPT